jgi:TPR repeat protein
MYENGDGIRKDLIQAHFWFRVAGDQKHADARKRRRRVAKRMTPEQIAYADMLARHRKRDRKSED